MRLWAMRLGAPCAACLYLCLISPVHRWLVEALEPAAAPTAVAGQSIAAPGAPQNPSCCCPHKDGICEKGCCRGDGVDAGGVCFRACGASPGHQALAFEPLCHPAPYPAGYVPTEAADSPFAVPDPEPLHAIPRAREKVPIA